MHYVAQCVCVCVCVCVCHIQCSKSGKSLEHCAIELGQGCDLDGPARSVDTIMKI